MEKFPKYSSEVFILHTLRTEIAEGGYCIYQWGGNVGLSKEFCSSPSIWEVHAQGNEVTSRRLMGELRLSLHH